MLGCIQPMSSPMMKTMLGFCCDCWASAGASVAAVAAHSAVRPRQTELLVLIMALLQVECLAPPGSDVVIAGEAHGRRPQWTSTGLVNREASALIPYRSPRSMLLS